MSSNKIILSESEMPNAWYNIIPDLPSPMTPYLKPDGSIIGPADLAPLFPMELIKQEVSPERWIEIPDEVKEIIRIWRPSPLHRAFNLEKELKTPARIYFKNEGVSPSGSHKGRCNPHCYRNWRGPVGQRAVIRLQTLRA